MLFIISKLMFREFIVKFNKGIGQGFALLISILLDIADTFSYHSSYTVNTVKGQSSSISLWTILISTITP